MNMTMVRMDTQIEQIYHFLQLDEHLATAGQPLEDELQAVADAGYEIVINLALHDADYSLDDERSFVDQLGMDYIHIPVIWDAPQLSDLKKFFATMDQCAGKKLFVHCAANMRVSAFMALYRILRLGWSEDQAFMAVYAIWEPESEPVWYHFMQTALTHFKS